MAEESRPKKFEVKFTPQDEWEKSQTTRKDRTQRAQEYLDVVNDIPRGQVASFTVPLPDGEKGTDIRLDIEKAIELAGIKDLVVKTRTQRSKRQTMVSLLYRKPGETIPEESLDTEESEEETEKTVSPRAGRNR